MPHDPPSQRCLWCALPPRLRPDCCSGACELRRPRRTAKQLPRTVVVEKVIHAAPDEIRRAVASARKKWTENRLNEMERRLDALDELLSVYPPWAFARICETILPERYAARKEPRKPSEDYPGGPAKIGAMAERRTRREHLHHSGDLTVAKLADHLAALPRRGEDGELEVIDLRDAPARGPHRFDDGDCAEFEGELLRAAGSAPGRAFNPAEAGKRRGIALAEDDGRHARARTTHAG